MKILTSVYIKLFVISIKYMFHALYGKSIFKINLKVPCFNVHAQNSFKKNQCKNYRSQFLITPQKTSRTFKINL